MTELENTFVQHQQEMSGMEEASDSDDTANLLTKHSQ